MLLKIYSVLQGHNMRLAKVIIKNFKCLEKVEITIPQTDESRSGSADFISIIGKNNVGKSSVLEALRFALPDGDLNKPDINYFQNRKDKNEGGKAIEIELQFDITFKEIKDMLGKKEDIGENKQITCFLIRQIWENAKENPQITWEIQGIASKSGKTLPANIKKHLPQAVYLPAVKDLSEEIGAKKGAA